jgi:ABC-type multidrug transport system ATPase subunit
MAYLPEQGGVPTHLTGREALRWWARLTGITELSVERVEAGLAAVDLLAAAERRVATYSKGMQQRLALAQALLPEPELLLLDEPFSGVDPLGVDRLVDLLGHLRRGGATIVLTSHLLQRVEQVCDEVVLLDHGRTIAAGPVADVLGEAPVRQRGLDDVFREKLKGGTG